MRYSVSMSYVTPESLVSTGVWRFLPSLDRKEGFAYSWYVGVYYGAACAYPLFWQHIIYDKGGL
ncbi:Uncharacterised protein [Paenibacillus macerans]|nr:hypothetical protein PbDSM24746_59630 [Paenibacillus macerans]GBK72288.1 hypothetical protein PbJCM17693_59960 [Paenibacillus macerans]GIP12790.1 hypothetical protein J1TS5_49600 [Paenibacillus macerans]SUA86467.1 Uncharacterised protein [Paenibacillus macerans]